MEQETYFEEIPELPSNVKFSCDFKNCINELVTLTKDRTITFEEFVTLRLKVLSLFDYYNKQLYKGTSLEYQPEQPRQQQIKQIHHQQTSSTPKTSLSGRRGRPKLDHNRVCYICQTTKTSEWRTGEIPNTFLCNACGLKALKKKKKSVVTDFNEVIPNYPNVTSYTQN